MGTSRRGHQRESLPAGHLPYRPYTLSPHDAGWLIEDVWPSLYFGAERVAEMRRKIDCLDWAREAVALMRLEADQVMRSAPYVPLVPCGWRHDFYSRQTGAHLLYEPDRGNAFLDPATGRREADLAQRRAWALLTHERTFRMMRSLGFLYRLTGEDRYAAWVASGMRLAAEYFDHTEFRRGEALYFQSLYDAGIVAMLANAYELTYDSGAYSDCDRRDIDERIFTERVPAIANFAGRGAANMDCFVAAALVSAGRATGREEWVHQGTVGFLSLSEQLTRSVPGDPGSPGDEPDGFWSEGSTFYHLYSACALVTVREATRDRGLGPDEATERRFAALLQAPVALSDSQFRLPVLGDLGDPRHLNLAAYRHLYEYAAGQVDAELFGPVLAELYRQSDAPRTELAALAYGPDHLASSTRTGGRGRGAARPHRSRVLPRAGIVVFEVTAPEPMWLLFRAGDYGRGHDHPDRLSLVLHAGRELVSPDPGTPGYSLRDRVGRYFESTLAHNTVLVDDKDLTASAELTWDLQARPQVATGTVHVNGVTISRTVSLDPPYVIVTDAFESTTVHSYGLVFHAYGPVTVDRPDLEDAADAARPPTLPTTGPWSAITGRRSGSTSGRTTATWSPAPGLRLELSSRLTPTGRYGVGCANAPGQPFDDVQGLLLLQVTARRCRWETTLRVTPIT